MKNKKFKFISKIGFELEGVFLVDYEELLKKTGGRMVNDGSIDALETIGGYYINNDGTEYAEYEVIEKEFNSQPRANLEDIKKDIDELKKYFVGYNETCGCHIHLSFKKDIYYSFLGSKDFFNYFVDSVSKTFLSMWEIRKNCSYCSPDITKKEVINCFAGDASSGSRYRAVNFLSITKHKTIEFRIFDANIDKIYSYIVFTANLVEDYLKRNIKKEIIQKIRVRKSEINNNIKKLCVRLLSL